MREAPRAADVGFYRERLQSFLDASKAGRLPAADLKPFHVQEWVDGRPTWGANRRRGAITSVQRAFAWAAKMGHVPASPVRGLDKPKAARRERLVSPDDYPRMRDSYEPGDPFRDLVEFLWETGGGPRRRGGSSRDTSIWTRSWSRSRRLGRGARSGGGWSG